MSMTFWRVVCIGVLFCLVLVAPASARNTHGLPSQGEESQAVWGDAFQAYVRENCLHGTDADTTVVITNCRAYVRDSSAQKYQLRYVEDLTSRSITYSAGAGTYWLAVRANLSVTPGGWTCAAGTHYCWFLAASRPTLPAATLLVAKSTVAGGAVTAVADCRRSAPTGVRSVTDPLFGADPTGATDSRAAFQAALKNAQDQLGGVVLVPPGDFLLTGNVLVGHRTTLQCTPYQTVLRASGTFVDLVRLQVAGTIANSPAVRDCLFDGTGTVNYAIAIDTSNAVSITRNLICNFLIAGIRTDPSVNGNIDHGEVSYNHVHNPESCTAYGLPTGTQTPSFFHSFPANNSTVDLFTFQGNTNGRAGNWCYILDTVQRTTIRDHWCGNNIDGTWTQGGVLIRNTGETFDPERNADAIVIDGLNLENDNAYPTPIGVEVDCNYSVAGAPGRSQRHQFRNIRSGQTGTTDNILIRIGISGTNCLVEENEIFWPKQTYDQNNLRIIIGAGVTDTRIHAPDTNNDMKNILQDSGTRTYVNGTLMTLPASGIKANRPAAIEIGRGMITATNDGTDGAGFPQMRFWTADPLGNIVHLGGKTTQFLQTILTSADQFEELGRLGAHTTVLRASLYTMEAWNSSGTDEIKCGTGAAGAVNVQIFGLTDVTTTGLDTPAVGSRLGPFATATTYNCEYVNGGSEPTTGKTLIIVEFLDTMAMP